MLGFKKMKKQKVEEKVCAKSMPTVGMTMAFSVDGKLYPASMANPLIPAYEYRGRLYGTRRALEAAIIFEMAREEDLWIFVPKHSAMPDAENKTVRLIDLFDRARAKVNEMLGEGV